MIRSVPGASAWMEQVPGGPVLMPLTPLLPGQLLLRWGETPAIPANK